MLVSDDAVALHVAAHIAFFVVVAAHIGLVLKHQLIDRDHLHPADDLRSGRDPRHPHFWAASSPNHGVRVAAGHVAGSQLAPQMTTATRSPAAGT